MRDTDYGKKVGLALKAVATMHSQVSRLLSDCDSLFPDYASVFGNIVTSELTYHVKADFWMAEGVYRYWFKQDQSVVGVTVIFHQGEGKLEQPILVVGYLDYLDVNSQNIRQWCNGWHLWSAAMEWCPQPVRLGEVISLSDPDGKGTIQNMKFIVVALFQIESLDDVKTLFKRIGVDLPD